MVSFRASSVSFPTKTTPVNGWCDESNMCRERKLESVNTENPQLGWSRGLSVRRSLGLASAVNGGFDGPHRSFLIDR